VAESGQPTSSGFDITLQLTRCYSMYDMLPRKVHHAAAKETPNPLIVRRVEMRVERRVECYFLNEIHNMLHPLLVCAECPIPSHSGHSHIHWEALIFSHTEREREGGRERP
jgi:hypothetical protein